MQYFFEFWRMQHRVINLLYCTTWYVGLIYVIYILSKHLILLSNHEKNKITWNMGILFVSNLISDVGLIWFTVTVHDLISVIKKNKYKNTLLISLFFLFLNLFIPCHFCSTYYESKRWMVCVLGRSKWWFTI